MPSNLYSGARTADAGSGGYDDEGSLAEGGAASHGGEVATYGEVEGKSDTPSPTVGYDGSEAAVNLANGLGEGLGTGLALLDRKDSSGWSARMVLELEKFLVRSAVAATAATLESFPQAKLGKWAGKGPIDRWLKPLKSLDVEKDGELTSFVLKPGRGSAPLRLRFDRNAERTCALLTKVLPVNGRDDFEVVNAKTHKSSRLPHPFAGKTCNKDQLAAFWFFNIDASAEKTGDPELVVMAGRQKGNRGVWGFFREGRAKTGSPAKPRLASSLETFFKPL